MLKLKGNLVLNSKETDLKHESALPMALIGVDIRFLKGFFLQHLTSLKRTSSSCQPLPSSWLIWKTLSGTKGWYFSPWSTFKLVQLKLKRGQGFNSAECTTTRHLELPPSWSKISFLHLQVNYTLYLASVWYCPSSPSALHSALVAATIMLVNYAGVAIFHRLWSTAEKG